jgi:hypothetical protein
MAFQRSDDYEAKESQKVINIAKKRVFNHYTSTTLSVGGKMRLIDVITMEPGQIAAVNVDYEVVVGLIKKARVVLTKLNKLNKTAKQCQEEDEKFRGEPASVMKHGNLTIHTKLKGALHWLEDNDDKKDGKWIISQTNNKMIHVGCEHNDQSMLTPGSLSLLSRSCGTCGAFARMKCVTPGCLFWFCSNLCYTANPMGHYRPCPKYVLSFVYFIFLFL